MKWAKALLVMVWRAWAVAASWIHDAARHTLPPSLAVAYAASRRVSTPSAGRQRVMLHAPIYKTTPTSCMLGVCKTPIMKAPAALRVYR